MQQLPDSPATGLTTLSGFRGLRAELLVALKKAPHALTARELAVRFDLTPNALRRHLQALEDEGLVRYRREVRGVGAPVFAYALTEAGQAHLAEETATWLRYAATVTRILTRPLTEPHGAGPGARPAGGMPGLGSALPAT